MTKALARWTLRGAKVQDGNHVCADRGGDTRYPVFSLRPLPRWVSVKVVSPNHCPYLGVPIDGFIDIVRTWLDESDDLLIMSIFGAGDRDYAFCRSEDDVRTFLNASGSEFQYPLTVCLYRGFRLPLRGVVDEGFIREAIKLLPDNTESVIVRLAPRRGILLGGNWCENHREVVAELRDNLSETVAFGPLPDWDPRDRRSPDVRGWIVWNTGQS